ncbi:hypothetical protein PFICI_10365 [Pestalotiopsis fici W106-1]|uniref:Uncharacterized protein n=1 Tax=Pestalotiopsis fici (strain W106-1 / CGMCC3.15140) TaxID=1229662 RepID=W3WWP9_PESFW|nr:uncharacterized protein PFICI_10365 [Pestalotiopsis fici W106-1]ETS78303.1 hypothetical protein PFICI_10365 [Pestalotiopsis fici W106-1]
MRYPFAGRTETPSDAIRDMKPAPSPASAQTAIYSPEKKILPPTPDEEESFARYDLVSTHRNLTRMSQYLLKLEARTSTASKIHVRKTLDAMVENAEYSCGENMERGSASGNHHQQLIFDIECLSSDVWARMHQLDREFRRLSRETRDAETGQSKSFELRGESYVKRWIQQEIDHNALRGEETIWYTVRDMNNQRCLRDWLDLLADVHNRGAQPIVDEERLVQLAWHYLDRSIRPPKPEIAMQTADFINWWHDLRLSGAFDGAKRDPDFQRREDEEALKSLQSTWTTKMAV